MKEISIVSAHEVDPELLLNFYHSMHSNVSNFLPQIWKWLYRTEFHDNQIPLVLLFENRRVIAHAGMIPFKVLLNEKIYTASWFVDFAILPDFQRRGLGSLLTERWIEFSDLCVTFCNEKSMGVFNKYGWVKSSDTYLHRYILSPFDFPRLANRLPSQLRKFLNKTTQLFFRLLYDRYAFQNNKIKINPLNADLLSQLIHTPSSQNQVVPIRDRDYVSWRLLDSPNRNQYFVLSVNDRDDIYMIVKFCQGSHNYIDILWTSNLSQYTLIRQMIASLARSEISNGYTYIRFFTSNPVLSDFLNHALKPVVRNPLFAFYSKNLNLLKQVTQHSNWQWELIDSDFEEFYDIVQKEIT